MRSDNENDHEERLRNQAYLIWLDEGQPDGRAEAHWRLACEAAEARNSEGNTNAGVIRTGTGASES